MMFFRPISSELWITAEDYELGKFEPSSGIWFWLRWISGAYCAMAFADGLYLFSGARL